MTGTAGSRRHILTEGDLPWLMNRMALEAGLQCQSLGMGFVAGKAGRLETVRCVTRHAGNLRVLARECDELFTDGTVTVEAGIGKQGRCRDLPRRVGGCMACDAIGDLRSMWCFMAGGTLGHDRIPIPLARVIGMKTVVAVLTGETVPSAAVLEIPELTDVALGALGRRERLRLGGIQFRGLGYRNGCDLFPLCCG